MEPTSTTAGSATGSLLSLLAHGGGRTAALSLLHERALEATGGSCSLLFEPHPADGHMQATSGAGLDTLPVGSWMPAGPEATLVAQAFTTRAAVAVPAVADAMPLLFERLRTDRAILVPLQNDARRVGLLVIGMPTDPGTGAAALDTGDVPAGFVLALELSRLRQHEEFERDTRELLDAFAGHLASTLDLARALEPLCVAATHLFGADRTTVWLLDREARSLVPLASSDPAFPERTGPVRADDPLAPAASALRSERAGLASVRTEPTSVLTVPLRGCRRALGSVVFEGVRVEPGDDITLLNRAGELGRQLSGAVETLQLLDVVMQSRRELEQLPVIAQQEREELRRRLIQSEKLAALGHFVAGIAHELNNPLQSVLGHLELLRATGAFPDGIRRDIRMVYRDADRAAQTVRSLLVFTGSGHLLRRRVAVNSVLQKALAARRASWESLHIEVVRHYDQRLPRIQADPLLLHHVFRNVVMNAEQSVSATGRPGRIEITTRPGDEDGWIVATVRDTGTGISDDALAHLFEPFYTTRDVGQGAGLGLALAYGIVRDHGGRISAANHPDGGAVLTVELPVA